MGVWTRDTSVALDQFHDGFQLLASINAGDTYLRAHLRWGIFGTTGLDVDFSAIAQNIITMGLVTTIGNGSETPPNARLNASDQAPPTQRWIYWETRGIRPCYVDSGAGAAGWIDTGSTEPTDTKGQVLATGLPAGDTLNLWASWAGAGDWDPSGDVVIWLGASILTKS